MTDPVVSVIVPCFNAELALPGCLSSILSQTFVDFEVICVDNGSNDRTAEVIAEYACADQRIVQAREERRGSGAARNRGLSFARGKYCWFVDADDVLADDSALDALVSTARKEGVQVVRGNHLRYDRDRNKASQQVFCGQPMFIEEPQVVHWSENPLLWVPWFHWVFLIETSLLRDHGFRYPDFLRGQDPPFLLRVFMAVDRIACIDKVVYRYCFSSTQDYHTIPYNEKICRDYLHHFADVKSLMILGGYKKPWRVYAAWAVLNIPRLLPEVLAEEGTELVNDFLNLFSDFWNLRDIEMGPFKADIDWGVVFVALAACDAKARGQNAASFRFLNQGIDLSDINHFGLTCGNFSLLSPPEGNPKTLQRNSLLYFLKRIYLYATRIIKNISFIHL